MSGGRVKFTLTEEDAHLLFRLLEWGIEERGHYLEQYGERDYTPHELMVAMVEHQDAERLRARMLQMADAQEGKKK